MKTHTGYEAMKDPFERGAAIAIIIEVRKKLKEEGIEEIFTVQKKSPQFTDKAAAFINESLKGEIGTIAFCFVKAADLDKKADGEITATITLAKSEKIQANQ